MKRIYFRLVKDPGIFSAIIRWYTWSEWSHVEFRVDNGWLGARLKGGVIVRPFDYLKPLAQSLRYIEVADIQYEAWQKFCDAQIGKPYDWKAIIGLGLRAKLAEPNEAWFCDEFVDVGCQAASTPLLNTDYPWRLTPRDIGLSLVPKTE